MERRLQPFASVMAIANLISEVDLGWDLGSETEQPVVANPPIEAVSHPASFSATDSEVDDGWSLASDDELGPAAAAEVEECQQAAGQIITLVAELPDNADGWMPADDEDPLLELSDEERAFFRAGDELAKAPVRTESFADLEVGPKPGFWQRFWRKAG
jgi:hypothetical protein